MMTSKSISRRLNVFLSPSTISGITTDRQLALTFRVFVKVVNISECRLVISSDPNIFRDSNQEIDVFFSLPIDEQYVDVTLTPVKVTTVPVWVNIVAKAAESAQACGFFAAVS